MEQRKLGLVGVTSLTLVALIGTGMFFGPALSASFAGPAALIAWVILGLQTIYVGVLFAELAALHPKAGGIYEFSKHAYGRFASFLTGWIMWLVATINTSILVVGALQYAFPLLPLAPKIGAAVGLIIALHLVAYKGLGWTEILLNFFAASLLAFILLTIVGGLPHVHTDAYTPFFTTGVLPILAALFFILETYFGWEAACFLAEETKNPEKTIPRAIVISSGLGAVLGIALTAVMFGIIPAGQLSASAAPLADVFNVIFGGIGATILKVGVFVALIGSAAGNIVSGPRLLLAMARDKLFIAQFSTVSEHTGTPARAIAFQAVVSTLVLFAAFGNYTLLLSIMVPLALLMYIPTLLAVPILRHKQPGDRTFKAPLAGVGAIIASIVFFAALAGWVLIDPSAPRVLGFIASLVLFGLPIYLLLSIYYNPSTQLFFMDALARPAVWLEGLIMPASIKRKMLSLFSNLQGKTILEFGAGVGSLTLPLAEAATPSGRVIALEAGKNNVELLLRRIAKERHTHVQAIHDEHLANRLHPEVRAVDAVFSTGMLGYLQDTEKVLKEIAAAMPEHGTVCFMEWVDYFGFLPNPPWLSDLTALKREFRNAGFSVRIEKVKGLLWNYLLVYGVKSKHDIAFA